MPVRRYLSVLLAGHLVYWSIGRFASWPMGKPLPQSCLACFLYHCNGRQVAQGSGPPNRPCANQPSPCPSPKLPPSQVHRTRFQLTCKLCGQQHGACTQCCEPRCYVGFHPLCARHAGYGMEVSEEVAVVLGVLQNAGGQAVLSVLCWGGCAAVAQDAVQGKTGRVRASSGGLDDTVAMCQAAQQVVCQLPP